jgi:hypothetical protein
MNCDFALDIFRNEGKMIRPIKFMFSIPEDINAIEQ